jgi:hypothetical protein
MLLEAFLLLSKLLNVFLRAHHVDVVYSSSVMNIALMQAFFVRKLYAGMKRKGPA